MPEFAGRLRFRRIEKPKDDDALAFSCGPGEHEKEVDELVIKQFTGVAIQHPAVYVLEDTARRPTQTVGAVAWRLWVSPVSRDPSVLDQVYIHLIGLNQLYRKQWMPSPDGRTLGHVLLARSLERIRDDWHPSPMPAVWAAVSPDNDKSRDMFGAHEFTRYTNVPGWRDDIMWRPAKTGVTHAAEAALR